MPQHYLGLEDAGPWAGSTVTNATAGVVSGPGNAHNLDTFTGLTLGAGTRGTTHDIEGGALVCRLTAVGEVRETIDLSLPASGWSVIVPVVLSEIPTDTASGNGWAGYLRIRYGSDENNFVRLRLNATAGSVLDRTVGGVAQTAVNGPSSPALRSCVLNLERPAGSNTVTARILRSDAAQSPTASWGWETVGTGDVSAFPAVSPVIDIGVLVAAAAGTGRAFAQFGYVRNLYPQAATATIESPAMRTIEGVRSVFARTLLAPSATTGSLAVEIRTAATEGGLSSAVYAAATPSHVLGLLSAAQAQASDWCQVRLRWTGMSTTAPAPYVSPVVVGSGLTQANAEQLFGFFRAAVSRGFLPTTYRLSMGETPAGSLEAWGRVAEGDIGSWRTSVTRRGTTIDLVGQTAPGLVREATGGGVSAIQFAINAAQWLPRLVHALAAGGAAATAATAYLTALTGPNKASLSAQVDTNPAQTGGGNGDGMILACRAAIGYLRSNDPTGTASSWSAQSDASLNTYYNGQQAHLVGDGALDDALVAADGEQVADQYAAVNAANYANVLVARPGYQTTGLRSVVGRTYRHFRDRLDENGIGTVHGRSINSGYRLYGGTYLIELARGLGLAAGASLLAEAREAAARNVYNALATIVCWEMGALAWVTKGWSVEGRYQEGYAPYGVLLAIVASRIGRLCGEDSAVFSSAPNAPAASPALPGDGASGPVAMVWPLGRQAFVRSAEGAGAGAEGMEVRIGNYLAQSGNVAQYQTRLVSSRRGRLGFSGSARPDFSGLPAWRRDTATGGGAANNFCWLYKPNFGFRMRRVGGGVACKESGVPHEFTPASATGTLLTGVTQTNAYLVAGRRRYSALRIDTGATAVSVSILQQLALTVPLRATDAAANTATGGTGATQHAYQQGAGEWSGGGNLLSSFIRGGVGPATGTVTPSTGVRTGSALESQGFLAHTGTSPLLQQAAPGGSPYAGTGASAVRRFWEESYRAGAMVAATEAAHTTGATQATGYYTWAEGTGTTNAATGATDGPAVGLLTDQLAGVAGPIVLGDYTLTGSGSSIHEARLMTDLARGGAGDVTQISHATAGVLVSQSVAGSVAWDKGTAANNSARIWTDTTGDLTVYTALLGGPASLVRAVDPLTGAETDVTGACTLLPDRVTVPAAVLSSYRTADGGGIYAELTVGPGPVDLSAALTLPALVGSGIANVGVQAQAALTLPALTASATLTTGTVPGSGAREFSAALTLPALTAAATLTTGTAPTPEPVPLLAAVYAQARDAMGGLTEAQVPDSALAVKAANELRRLRSLWPCAFGADSHTLSADLTADEVLDVQQAAGHYVAAEYLGTPAGRKFAADLAKSVTREKAGPVDVTYSSQSGGMTVGDVIESIRRGGADAIGRVRCVAAAVGEPALFARSGRWVAVDDREPRTVVEAAFGPRDDREGWDGAIGGDWAGDD